MSEERGVVYERGEGVWVSSERGGGMGEGVYERGDSYGGAYALDRSHAL